jgi:DNA-directed RNA polymerase subunit RPC12/RpoP/HAMP domain-containing protein
MERHMIVICEECGRKYRVDPARIIGQSAGFSCRACGHRIRVVKPERPPAPAAEPAAAAPTPSSPEPAAAAWPPEAPGFQPTGLGLRAKAWVLGFLLPGLLPLAAAGVVLLEPDWLAAMNVDDLKLLLLLLCAGVLALLAVGLGYGLRLARRVERLAEAAERLASGADASMVAPGSGDDVDRAAAGVRSLAERRRVRAESEQQGP